MHRFSLIGIIWGMSSKNTTRPTAERPRRSPAPGVIRTDAAYSLRALARLTGLKEHGLRQLRLLGLPVAQVGRERWVLGEDFVALVRRLRDRGNRASDWQTDRGEGN